MRPEDRNTIRRNRPHFIEARAAATLSIMADPKLLGIPSTRAGLIAIATLRAMGCEDVVTTRNFRPSHEDNATPMVEAVARAEEAARLALTRLGPLRPARPRKVLVSGLAA